MKPDAVWMDICESKMGKRVCHWWLGYFLTCPLLRRGPKPAKLLAPYVHQGMTVLEPGPGMGFFTIELARMVGAAGHVIAVDVQPKMLVGLKRRLARAGLAERVEIRQALPESLNLPSTLAVDFTLIFAVAHEVPNLSAFFQDVAKASRTGAQVLFCEPKGHVRAALFEQELNTARQAGLQPLEWPSVKGSHSVLLHKTG